MKFEGSGLMFLVTGCHCERSEKNYKVQLGN